MLKRTDMKRFVYFFAPLVLVDPPEAAGHKGGAQLIILNSGHLAVACSANKNHFTSIFGSKNHVKKYYLGLWTEEELLTANEHNLIRDTFNTLAGQLTRDVFLPARVDKVGPPGYIFSESIYNFRVLTT